jgi:uncharacterized protein YktB (UPF0637 family)
MKDSKFQLVQSFDDWDYTQDYDLMGSFWDQIFMRFGIIYDTDSIREYRELFKVRQNIIFIACYKVL